MAEPLYQRGPGVPTCIKAPYRYTLMTRNPELVTRRVAVLANSLHTYQSKIVSGVRDVLSRSGMECVVLLGQTLRNPSAEAVHANDVYSFIDANNFCGVIILSAAIGPHVTDAELGEWIKSFGSLPVVSIGRPIPGASNILIDNRPGMSALMTHLLDSIGSRKLAFVRGIAGNADSEERESVYRTALQQRDIPVEEGLFLTGDFASVRTFRAVSQLLENRRDIDAIVCANDEMADGAIQAITAAGLRVPHDIAVAGFDDAIHHVVPALTTVRLPIYEQGREAAQMLVEMLKKPRLVNTLFIEPRLVVRDSCGGSGKAMAVAPSLADATGLPDYLAEAQQELLAMFDRMAPTPDQHIAFLNEWYAQLSRRELLDVEYVMWRDGLVSHSSQQRADPEVNQLAIAALSSLASMVQMSSSRRHSLRADLGEVTPRLFGCQDHEGLLAELPKFLKHVGLERYAFVQYEKFGSQPAERAKVVLDRTGCKAVNASWFPTRDIIPQAMREEIASELLVLSPLFVNATHYGFMLYQPAPWWGPFPDTSFCHTISHAICQVENTIAERNYSFQLECQVQARTSALEAQVAETMKAEQALRVANASLQYAAFHDGLTQLYNRAAFNEHFESQWSQHLKQQRPMSLLLCDVDHFKKYNDLYGHVLGDECLKQIAQALRRAVRSQRDIVARYGGEEFVVVLPFTDSVVAARVAERIQHEIVSLNLPHAASGVGDHVTVSIGVATATPRADTIKETLVERADVCLYQAKSAGRARFVMAEAA